MSEPQPTAASAQTKDSSLLHTLGWAVFLGVSWTWCIGMFLPTILVRDYGVWGWVVFAVPNVVGAALMGWVLRERTASERVAWAHRGAGVFFSVVTIAFHAYWVYWVARAMIGPAALAATPLLAVGFFLAGRAGRRADLLLAAVVWAASLACFVLYGMWKRGPLQWGTGAQPASDLLPLALVCLLGFALCPYLDLTFHRARQATASRAGVLSFAAGFGVAFLLMILFTLAYAPALAARPEHWHVRLSGTAAWAIGTHMTIQAALTVAYHAREVARRWPTPDSHVRVGGLAAVVASFFPLVAGSLAGGPVPADEQIYRLFLAFYALVFPAYVWIVMVPRRGSRTAEPTRRALIAFAIAVCAAGPMYWVAFVNGRMNWLIAGVAVVILGRWIVPHRRMKDEG